MMMTIMMIPTTAIPMIAVVDKPALAESVEKLISVLGLVVGLVSVVGLAVLERSVLEFDSVLSSEDKLMLKKIIWVGELLSCKIRG